jgi:hypothetical protein
VKIGEWDSLGRARALLQKQVGDLGASELATHVSTNRDNGRQRILVATDVGLLDYSWAPMSPDPNSPWLLRGLVVRWQNVHGMRLQTDGQLDPNTNEARSVWRLIAEDPKIELLADTTTEEGVAPLLAFAGACLRFAG